MLILVVECPMLKSIQQQSLFLFVSIDPNSLKIRISEHLVKLNLISQTGCKVHLNADRINILF